MKATPQIDTLFKVLHPLGYTIEIVPLRQKNALHVAHKLLELAPGVEDIELELP